MRYTSSPLNMRLLYSHTGEPFDTQRCMLRLRETTMQLIRRVNPLCRRVMIRYGLISRPGVSIPLNLDEVSYFVNGSWQTAESLFAADDETLIPEMVYLEVIGTNYATLRFQAEGMEAESQLLLDELEPNDGTDQV